MTKHFEAIYQVEEKQLAKEDGGQAIIFHEDPVTETGAGVDGCFHVRLQSWDETLKHPSIRSLAGRRIRVSIEILD